MRNIDLLVIHCSDSDNPRHDNVQTIKDWHVKGNKWKNIGYHFIITKDGEVHTGRPIWEQGAHCKGHNENSIGICLTGSRWFSQEQREACKYLVDELLPQFGLDYIDVCPHNLFNDKKSCPNINIYSEILGIKSK